MYFCRCRYFIYLTALLAMSSRFDPELVTKRSQSLHNLRFCILKCKDKVPPKRVFIAPTLYATTHASTQKLSLLVSADASLSGRDQVSHPYETTNINFRTARLYDFRWYGGRQNKRTSSIVLKTHWRPDE